MTSSLQAFLPELVLLAGALGLFFVTLKKDGAETARSVVLLTALAALVACAFSFGSQATLFDSTG